METHRLTLRAKTKPLWDHQDTVMDRCEAHRSGREEIEPTKGICREGFRNATKNGKAVQLCNGFRDKLELCIAAGG